MLTLWRAVLFVATLFVLSLIIDNALSAPETGDLWNAGFMALFIVIAVANGIVWAPAIGDAVAGPLTFSYTGEGEECFDDDKRIIRWIRYLDSVGRRRTVRWYCLFAGLRFPRMPTPFVIGLKNSPKGSRWERYFARRAYYFDSAHTALQAMEVLLRHGIERPTHPRPQVEVFLRRHLPRPGRNRPSIKAPRFESKVVIKRNQQIKLFAGAERLADPEPGTSSTDSAR